MDTILRKPEVSRFNISDHLEFHQLSYRLCNGQERIIDAPALIAAYKEAVAQEESVFKWVRKSDFTVKKAETDHARDRIYNGIMEIIRANMKHFDPAIRDHAVHVYNLLEIYGNLAKADYDAETADIDNIIARLISVNYKDSIIALGLTEWISELNNQNELFKSYVDSTKNEQLSKPEIEPVKARRQTDEALRAITKRVVSLVILNGIDDYAEFIEEFNVMVNHYNTIVHEHYGRLHARKDITQAVIDTIPVQQYTGKSVFVIPELTLTIEKEGKQIILHPEFSVDFTVRYKNNINVGTATLIISGIGKYKGEITTTFNIEKTV